MDKHKRITIDFSKSGGNTYDLVISTKMTVKQLLFALSTSLQEQINSNSVIRLPLKQITLQPEDQLLDCSISNGELLIVENELTKRGIMHGK
ncbi:EsaB/YukD family protein [Rummeliibacillus pycnus]|uniref:EsaB/YukD family protein n=1 Tax=Rummeliibacillus pycnus TaxID=101070 RepID=UPI000C9CBF3A|nr:EsaB/YukD family protein [Rummeliibacillus pycnus]